MRSGVLQQGKLEKGEFCKQYGKESQEQPGHYDFYQGKGSVHEAGQQEDQKGRRDSLHEWGGRDAARHV